jgi:type IV secretory pathway VirB6-like protein
VLHLQLGLHQVGEPGRVFTQFLNFLLKLGQILKWKIWVLTGSTSEVLIKSLAGVTVVAGLAPFFGPLIMWFFT